MATLNTLRTRGGIIVSVVIGVALLAFLLGDLTSSGGSNAQSITVGKIDGKKIGYIEYANQVDELTTVSQLMTGQTVNSSTEIDNLRDMAWESMMMTYSYIPGFDAMGITVGDAEQADMTMGEYISPVLSNIFIDRSTGAYSTDMLRSFIANLDADQSGQSRMIWNYLKKQMVEQRLVGKYMSLLSKGVYVTDLEVEKAVQDANEVFDANIIKVAYSTVADSLVRIKESEIKEYYNKNKEQFKQSSTRTVEYVAFDLNPSAEDYAVAEKTVNELAEEFKVAESPMQYAQLNSHSQPNSGFVKESDLDSKIAAAVFAKDEMYGPVLEDNKYVMVRRSDRKLLPDSIGAKHILIDPANTHLKDSLLRVIKAGSSFEMLASRFSEDTNSAMMGGSLGVFAPEQMIPEFSDACVSAKVGDVFSVDTQYGTHIIKLAYKSPMVAKVQVATVTYDVEPSDLTQQTAYGAARSFFNAAQGGVKNFRDATISGALAARSATLTVNDREIRGLEGSRELLRWVYNAKQSEVSSILDFDGGYVVAVVSAVSEQEYAPIEKVKSRIQSELTTEKKAEIISAKMKGDNLEVIAANVDATIEPASDVKYTDFTVGSSSYELKLIGAICSGLSMDELSKPVVGNSGVYVFDLFGADVQENSTFESEKVRLNATTQSYLAQRINMTLTELCEVEDFRVKYF